MALSQDLINQFVKLTDREEKPKEITVNGTYKTINGEEYVQIDGSEIWTPVTSTVEAETGERVKVMIKNHTATVTGNISSPSARSKSVQDLKDEIDEQGNTIKQLDNSIEQQGNSIIQINNNIKQVNNDILQANNAINQQGNIIKQLGNEINQQGDVINSMNNDITANSNEITAINNTIVQQNNTIIQHGNTIEQQGNIIKQQGNEINQQGNKIEQFNNEIEQQGNTITQLNNKILQQDNTIQQQGNIIDQQNNIITEHGNNITILNSGFSIIDGVLVGLSQAIIDELKTKHLDAEYATIDFANINIAAVEKLFTESGIIKDLVVKEGKITGELVGVTIKGDLIEGNTIAAEKLVVKGSDGLYYKLNIDGLNNVSTEQSSKFVLLDTKPEDWETNYKDYYLISGNNYVHITDNNIPTWQANTYYKLSSTYETGLDGTNIVAKSITADKVSVTDLVAFGATIGGYNITQHSIYSGGKSSVNNVSRGVYMDDDGQMAFGDNKNFIKFFKDTDKQYKIMIKADEIYTGSSSESIAEQMKKLDNLEIESGNLLFNYQKPKADSSQWSNIQEIITSGLPDEMTDVNFALRGNISSKYFVPFDQNKKYKISTWFKCMDDVKESTDPFYPSIIPYDIDKNLINYYQVLIGNGLKTITTLSQNLKAGDTIVHATDVSKWTAGIATPNRYVSIFNFESSNGYKYTNYTRTNLLFAGNNEPLTNIIDYTNNTIKLKAPYSGSTIPAGTKIAMTFDGSTYIYPWGRINLKQIADWTYKERIFDASSLNDTRLQNASYIRYMPNVWRSDVYTYDHKLTEYIGDVITSVANLYYSSDNLTLPAKPTTHITTNNTTMYNTWNISLPTYNEQYPYLFTCKEVRNKDGTYSWTTVNQTTYAEAIKTIQTELNAIQSDYLKETTFTTYKRDQIENDQGIKQRLSKTELTVYGDENNPEDPSALVNHIQQLENDVNGSNGAIDRIESAEDTIEGTGLNDYDQRIKITQRFLNVETDVEQIKNIFKITGGTNLVQNSVGYFADNNNKPTMWNIAANTIYTPFGYDGDLTGITVSRGRLFCAKGSVTTTPNNIVALLANKMMSISFKYKNGANATSKIKVFNGSVTYFEKTFSSAVNQWTEYTFNPDTDPVLANPTFLNTANSLQISIESTNSTNNNGFEISDLMLNYGDIKPWELSSNEVYGAMVKLSSLGIEVTATTANTKNFMTTDGILVYEYNSTTDTIGNLITKITDNGILTNRLESTGDIIERNLVNTMIKDSSNHDVYVEYIK